MSRRELQDMLTSYNHLWKEMDDVYHSLARHYGLSDCALWILYVIRESTEAHTQSQICEKLSLRKQTVNSALKNMEAAGYLRLESPTGSQRNKNVLLTKPGETLAEKTVDPILLMEQEAFGHFAPEERVLFLRLLQKYVSGLQTEAAKILAAPQERT